MTPVLAVVAAWTGTALVLNRLPISEALARRAARRRRRAAYLLNSPKGRA